MEKEFIPYEQALALKELGFDEGCFAIWSPGLSEFEISNIGNFRLFSSVIKIDSKQSNLLYINKKETVKVAAPLYQQAFRWFREKYNIECYVNCYWNEVDSSKRDYYANYNYGSDIFYSINIGFKNYEEAELECLKKLIEIVNSNES